MANNKTTYTGWLIMVREHKPGVVLEKGVWPPGSFVIWEGCHGEGHWGPCIHWETTLTPIGCQLLSEETAKRWMEELKDYPARFEMVIFKAT